jgi:hypothetical protein
MMMMMIKNDVIDKWFTNASGLWARVVAVGFLPTKLLCCFVVTFPVRPHSRRTARDVFVVSKQQQMLT